MKAVSALGYSLGFHVLICLFVVYKVFPFRADSSSLTPSVLPPKDEMDVELWSDEIKPETQSSTSSPHEWRSKDEKTTEVSRYGRATESTVSPEPSKPTSLPSERPSSAWTFSPMQDDSQAKLGIGNDTGASAHGLSAGSQRAIARVLGFQAGQEGERRAVDKAANRSVQSALDAADVGGGLSLGNPLREHVDRWMHKAEAPLLGAVTLVWDVFATGENRFSFQRAGGDEARWESWMKQIRSDFQSKKLKLPAGAKGMRFIISVVAKEVCPDGRKPGGGSSCSLVDGASVSENGVRPSFSVRFDVSNVGAVARRLVSTKIVSEERL